MLIALFVAVEFAFFVLFRRVNLDEGWYLWASKLVYDGRLLYRDFAYTQTPLLPFVYGLFLRLFGDGLYQGRILSAILGALSGLICCWIVRRHAGRAFLFCGALFATSFYTICYYVYSATYSLAAFFLISAVGVLFLFPRNNRSVNQELIGVVLAVVLISCAIATRMSAVGALPVLVLYIVLIDRKQVSFVRTVFVVGIVGMASAFILLGPFWLLAGERMVYDIFGFHTDRIPSITRQWYRQLTTLQRSGWIYAVPLVLMLIPVGIGLGARVRARLRSVAYYIVGPESDGPWWRRYGLEVALAGMILGPLLLHLVPRTTDAYYNALQFPLLCVLASLCVARLVEQLGDRQRGQSDDAEGTQDASASGSLASGSFVAAAGLRSVLVCLVVVNGLIHAGAVYYFGLVSWHGGGLLPNNQVETVREAAEFLRGADKVDNQLLTLNTHLALESGMAVPHGYEMSIFAYRPDWRAAEAYRYHVVNNEMLIADLEAGADAVAITDFDAERFYGKRQQIFDALTQNYRHAKTVAGFDPQFNNLQIYLPPQFGGSDPHYPLAAEFEHGIDLLGYDLPALRYRAGEVVDIALYWQTATSVDQPYTVFVQVLDPNGALVVGWDNPPCQRTCPTQSWRTGEVLRDEYRLALPDALDAGSYMVQIGLYNSNTAEPVQLVTLSSADAAMASGNLPIEFVDGRLRLTQIEVR